MGHGTQNEGSYTWTFEDGTTETFYATDDGYAPDEDDDDDEE